MKFVLGCLFAFLCGIVGGVGFSQKHRFSATAQPDAFAQWQKAAGADGGIDFHTRERLLPQMAAQDGPRAWKLLTQPGVKPRTTDLELVARQWARRDGPGAAAAGLAVTDPVERRAFLTVALSCWFGTEPEAFLKWLQRQPERESLAACITTLEYHALLKPEVASLDFVMALHPGQPQPFGPVSNLALNIYRHASQRQAVMTWLRRQPESETRDRIWRDIAADLAITDSQAAAALAKEISSEPIRRALLCKIAAWLAKTDAAKALAYAAKLPDEASRSDAWTSAFGTWLMQDPAAALAHARQHLDTLTTEKLKPVTHLLAETAPAEGLKILQALQGPDQSREAMVDTLVRAWIRRTPETARRWLASAEAEWLGPAVVKKYRLDAESPTWFGGGGGTRTIQGRRVWVNY